MPTMTIELDEQEGQAILNALRDSGALDGPLVFDHVTRLKAKVEKAMLAAFDFDYNYGGNH